MNLAELPLREFEKFGEHVSLIFKDQTYTNVQMRTTALRLADALRSLGIGKGDRVIVQMPNCPEVYQSFQALYILGAVVVPINYMVGDAETAHIYKDTGAKAVISTNQFRQKIEACRKEAPHLEHVILVEDNCSGGALSFRDLVAQSSADIEMARTADDDLAVLVYTAGTTGSPKGVMHTHRSLYSNAVMQQETLGMPSGITGVAVLPLCHSYGISTLNLAHLIGGGKIVVLDQIDVDAIFAAIEKYRGNSLAAVPTLYIYMLAHPDSKRYDLSSMKYWLSGSAPLALDTWRKFKENFGAEIIEGWGLTEAGANNATNPLKGTKKVGSIGKPMQGMQMRVVDDLGRPRPAGAPGEIVLSGPHIMKGYWNLPEETAKVIRGGWLYTGDMGYEDKDGYFFVTERKKDLIIKGGENIAPREIEEVLLQHSSVQESAVVGVFDEVYGENIKAFVVLSPGKTATAEGIIKHCHDRLRRFKSPREVVFLEALPKSMIGKTLRKELRKM